MTVMPFPKTLPGFRPYSADSTQRAARAPFAVEGVIGIFAPAAYVPDRCETEVGL